MKKFVFLLLLFFLLFGCVQLDSRQKLLCLDLVSYSYTSVPECNTQEECFAVAENELFGFDVKVFSSPVQEDISSFKNSLAKSWLYSNKAKAVAREIQGICSSNDHSLLPSKANELNFFVVKAFEEIEAMNSKAFSVLVLEASALEREEVELVSEEPLFDSFVEYNNALNELSDPKGFESDSFVSKYYSSSQKFQDLSESIGLKEQYVAEVGVLDLVDKYDDFVVSKIFQKNAFVVQIKEAVSSIVSAVKDARSLSNSVSLLEKIQAFNVFEGIDSFSGLDNSVASKFALLLRKDSESRKELLERNSFLKKEIISLINSSNSGISSLSFEELSFFDEKFLSEMFSLFGEKSAIQVTRYEFSSISGFQKEAGEKLAVLKNRFNLLESEIFLDSVSLGKEAFELKEIYSELKYLDESIAFVDEEVVSGVEGLCNSRVGFLEKEIESLSVSENSLSNALDLKLRLKQRISNYSSLERKEKLAQCKIILEDFELLKENVQEITYFEENFNSSTEKCISSLDSFFGSSIDLSTYFQEYSSIKKLKQPFINPVQVFEQCAYLEKKVKEKALQDNIVKDIISNYFSSKQYLSDLQVLNFLDSGIVSDSLLSSYKRDFESLEEFFSSSSINFEKALPELNHLSLMLLEQNFLLKEEILEKTSKYLEKHFLSSSSSIQEIVSNKNANSSVRLSISNPFAHSIEESLSLKIPWLFENSALVSSSVDSNYLVQDNSLFLTVSKLPLNSSFFVFDSNSVLLRSEEEEKLLTASLSFAVFEKTISLFPSSKILNAESKIYVEVPFNSVNVSAFRGGKRIPFFFSGKDSFLILDKVYENDKVLVYYSVPSPVLVQTKLLSSKRIDENVFEEVFQISLKNSLPVYLKNFQVSVPLNLGAESIMASELHDSSGRKVVFSMLPSSKIAFSVAELPPEQERYYSFFAEIENTELFWNSMLSKTKENLERLAVLNSYEISSKASELLNSNSFLLENFDYSLFEHKKHLTSVFNETQKLLELESEKEQLVSQYEILYLSLNEKLSNSVSNQKLFEDLGFFTEKTALSENSFALQKILEKAEYEKSLGNYNPALDELLKGESISFEFLEPKKLIDSKNESLFAKLSEINSKSEKFGFDQNLSKNEVLVLYEEISFLQSKEDLKLAVEKLSLLEAKVKEYESSFQKQLESKAFGISSKISLFRNLTRDNNAIKKSKLLFKGISSQDLEEIEYIAPTSIERLEGFAETLQGMRNNSLLQKANHFEDLLQKKSFEEAIEYSQDFFPEIEEKLEKAVSINSEIEEDFEKIQKDAAIFLDKAKIVLSNSSNIEALSLLEKAEKEYSEGDFLKSIQHSFYASLLPNAPVSFAALDVPFAVVPLIAVIAGIFVFRYWKKKQKEKPVEYRRIERKE